MHHWRYEYAHKECICTQLYNRQKLLVRSCYKSVSLWQEAMLCWPHRYTALLGACPSEARALRTVEPSKRKSYLEVAAVLLRKYPNASTSRSVTFLLKICNNYPPDGVPRLPWLEAPSAQARVINLTNSAAFAKLAPAMRFNAILRGWGIKGASLLELYAAISTGCWTVIFKECNNKLNRCIRAIPLACSL